jgi:hypothetical protein
MIYNHSRSITNHASQPLVRHSTPWFTSTGSALNTMVHNHWLRNFFWVSQWLWIILCYAQPVVVNNGVLCWGSGCELWCVVPCQWLYIVLCYAEPVVVNHGVLCWASGCESWCAMLSQWLWIMDCYDVPKVVYHFELCWASRCES